MNVFSFLVHSEVSLQCVKLEFSLYHIFTYFHSSFFINTGSTITNHTMHFIRLTFKNIQIEYKKRINK